MSTDAPADTASGSAATWPGYALPGGTYTATPLRHTSIGRLLWLLGGTLAVVVAVVAGVSLWLTPPTPQYVCPPDCGRPPIGTPVQAYPRFTAPDGAFSFAYPGDGTPFDVSMLPNGVLLNFVTGDRGTLRLFGEPAGDRTAREVAKDLFARTYPDATTAYEIPNAMVGYQPGYGEVADLYPQSANGNFTRVRLLVMVAVKNGLALVAAAAGPFHEFSPDFGSGHPSGANFQLALSLSPFVNSFTWRGDPPR